MKLSVFWIRGPDSGCSLSNWDCFKQAAHHVPFLPQSQPTSAVLEGDMMGLPYDPYTRGPPQPPCHDARLRAMAQLGPAVDGEASSKN